MLNFLQRNRTNGNGASTPRVLVAEIIGRTRHFISRILHPLQSLDLGIADYKFWDHLRRGKQDGYELGGLFAKPIAKIYTAFTLGRGVAVASEDEDTAEDVNKFLKDNWHEILRSYEHSIALGDMYIIINPDGSLQPVSPEKVEIMTDAVDQTQIIGYKITSSFTKSTIIDEIRLDGRTITITQSSPKPGVPNPTVLEFNNLIGRLPVVHIANELSTNELTGHPAYEALLNLFAEYDDVLKNSLAGVKLLSNPLLVAEDLGDAQKFLDDNKTGTETQKNADGKNITVPVIDLNDLEMFAVEGDGTLKFIQPDTFSVDAVAMLKKLFMLMLEHTSIPEWVWGGAVKSSKASVDAQAPAFVLQIMMRRLSAEKWILDLVDIWLRTQALFTPITIPDDISLQWEPVLEEDQTLLTAKVNAAFDRGALTPVTYLRLLHIVDDPEAEIERAKDEADARREEFEARLDQDLQNAIDSGSGHQSGHEDEEEEDEREREMA